MKFDTVSLVDGPWTTHGHCTHGTLQATKCRQQILLLEEFVKSGHELASEISGTTELHGPLRRIDLDSVDSEKFVRKRNRWCLTSDRIAKAFDGLEVTDVMSHLRQRRISCANQVDLESCEGRELLADDTVSELDLRSAGLAFLFERVQDTWE